VKIKKKKGIRENFKEMEDNVATVFFLSMKRDHFIHKLVTFC